ncbi:MULTISPECIES: phosphotransferase enzyme family protein [Nonomuraea]|uniref:Phosphotransferase enzyme family protein n=1 Tax=Nonomuraea mangrovi TaxID=2316207 RepID=A0ABW4SRH6_9ACTN
MELHDLSAGDGVLERVGAVARAALERYDVSPAATATLINVSENATFRVDDPETGGRSILRVHRLGYHSAAAIGSELDWLEALRREEGVRTPAVIEAADGAKVVGAGGRNVVMFAFLPGAEPREDRLVDGFKQLGAVTARMHRHAVRWRRPEGFTRFAWDWDAAFGAEARWGRWRDGVGVDGEAHAVLRRLEDRLRERIARYGRSPERFGLIHADMRLANLLDDGGPEPSVIDFDDCGFGWHVYDLAAALSFIEHEPVVPELIDAWLDGYRSEEPFTAEDEREIWTFILFRRLLLVAWIGSHQGVDIARELGEGYTRGACDLADRYLGSV